MLLEFFIRCAFISATNFFNLAINVWVVTKNHNNISVPNRPVPGVFWDNVLPSKFDEMIVL